MSGLRTHRIEMLLVADQPVRHLAETIGNAGYLMTRRVRLPRGGFAKVPEVTGDAMRNGLRRAGSRFTLAAAFPDGKVSLTEAAVRLLFAGGMVTGNGDSKSVRFGDYRKMVDLIPQLALLGGCAQNRTIPGRMEVSPATLVCAETAHSLPAWVAEACDAELGSPQRDGLRSYVEEAQRVRMDPLLNPLMRGLLDPGEADRLDRKLEASERASDEGDDAAKIATKSAMMPRRAERLCEGSVFFWAVEVTLTSEIDEDAFYSMLCAFAADMVVGGGRATGHGRLRLVKAHRIERRAPLEMPSAEEVAVVSMRPQCGRVLSSHLAERSHAIREFLERVDA